MEKRNRMRLGLYVPWKEVQEISWRPPPPPPAGGEDEWGGIYKKKVEGGDIEER
jgi:hypothetical protein